MNHETILVLLMGLFLLLLFLVAIASDAIATAELLAEPLSVITDTYPTEGVPGERG
jgi:hypothetical protein